ncbi:hypothetical protein K493DRAFT_379774 [Basidiobolus meristosporus CBS 931.73]|uniref:Pyrroline-5-carboxylate reductase catalytic N-terminal domain-containing protein n=1 Tax=Basidiobolus meristosporus CBS 931.73 TaxID=1314790 RepID=A0A1Y1XYW1_9FUNG|nr:hypothetical protein K493DRAFT_379774 [Basidiobolus meristosporus CBS 931.73]|eukprot:ORX90947.1 hypothetical protein K493DRAFT_379774 [Basidiobolus meristosporus CBS 931.73]
MAEPNERVASFIDIDEKPSVINTNGPTMNESRIGIIGTGWYGRALAARMVASDIEVILGSRDPAKVEFELPCKVVTYQEVISSCSTLFLTIPWAHHRSFVEQHGDALTGKVVVDVSNPKSLKESLSGGLCIVEKLQLLLPKSKIAKAFNTISAYSLQNQTRQTNQQVYICTDDSQLHDCLSLLVKKMGYHAVNAGTLSQARDVEALPLAFFEEWRIPFFFAVLVYVAFTLYVVITEYAVKKSSINDFPLILMNRIVACTAINMFAITNLAGCVANVVQLMRGTASRPFPMWLAHWLNHRKNLGLLGFAGILIHGCMGAISSFHTFQSHFSFQDQLGLLFANVSILLYGILSISSLPNISSSLSWREWRFIQSRLGWLALCIGFTHDLLITTPYWGYVREGKPPSLSLITAVLPACTIALKIVLTLPPVGWLLQRVLEGRK